MDITKVSIILPTYNGAKYLRESIDSCLNQTHKNIELIIVDDASTDQTPEIVRSYNDPRIKYIRNATNQRLPLSLNIGFAASSGEYLSWTSDDNYYAPTAIEEMAGHLMKNQADFVYCDFYYVHTGEGNFKVRELQDAAASLKYEDCIGACFMYTRKVYQAIGDYDHDMEYVEDYDYWARAFRHFPMQHIKKPLYYYRYHDMSISGTKRAEIEIMEFLLKLKYGFLNKEEVNWSLRGLRLKTTNNASIFNKISNRLIYKSQITRILDEFLKTKAARSARNELSAILYNKKRHVFLRKFDPAWDWGGAERLIVDVLDVIDDERCQATLVVPAGSKAIFEKNLKSRSKRVLIKEMPFTLRTNAWQRFWSMLAFLRTLKPAQIVFMQGWFADFRCAEFFAARLTAGRVYSHENSCPPEPIEKTSRTHAGRIKGIGLWWHLQKFYTRIKTIFCKNILVVSSDVGEKLAALWGYPKHKLTVVPHGTDASRFSPSPETRTRMRQVWGFGGSDIIIVAHTRIAPEKRLDRLIEAFDKTAADHPGIFLLIAGQGPADQELKNLAKTKLSFQKIRFLGPVENVADLLRAGDIYVCSSDIEGFGLALLEAMATGLTCVATQCSGPLEIIENSKNGFLVDKSEQGVASGLQKALGLTADQKRHMGESARETVIKKFDANRNIQRLLELLGIPFRK